MQTKISPWDLKQEISLESYLQSLLSCSKNLIKKHLSKKQREYRLIPNQNQEIILPLMLFNNDLVNPCYTGKPIEVLEDNDLFIALEKPAGINCFPMDYSETDSCLNFLRNKDVLITANENNEKGLLYRIDRDTSGVLIYIKNDQAHTLLRENFDTSVINKQYFAVVEGEFTKDGAQVHYLGKAGPKGSHVVASDFFDDKYPSKAIAHYKSLSFNPETNLSLVEVILKTGHRHQIRVQLKHLGYPICGDSLYHPNVDGFKRLALHASEYVFRFEDKIYTVKSKLDFKRLFKF